jgi:hypothetical protein
MQSARIKHWIIANHLTQQVVAERIGYLRGSVSRALAREQVSNDFWARFSAAFPEAAAELLLNAREQKMQEGLAEEL